MPSSSRALVSSLTAGLLTIAVPPLASAQLSPVGVVTRLDGTATLARVALPQETPLKPRDPVFVADRITTGDESTARILLGGKALVTVRERTVVTIKESAGVSTVDVGVGRMGIAVVKERMKPGELIEIRTPNAVAAIRGTVVITEVSRATSQVGATSGGFTTTITVVKGLVELRQLDALTRQPIGPAINLGALQSIRVSGVAPLRAPQPVAPDQVRAIAAEMKAEIKEVPAANAPIAQEQMRAAAIAMKAVVDGKEAPNLSEDAASASSDPPRRASGGSSSSGSSTSKGGSDKGQGGGSSAATAVTTSAPPASAPSTSAPSASGTTVSAPPASAPTLSAPTVSAPTVSSAPAASASAAPLPRATAPAAVMGAVAPTVNAIVTGGSNSGPSTPPVLPQQSTRGQGTVNRLEEQVGKLVKTTTSSRK